MVGALGAAFVLSGGAGLIHEVVWVRLLGLLFGVSELALATVLAAFMSGLALGSSWIGTRSARLADRRRTYALLEIGIGVLALLMPWLLAAVEPLYGVLWRRYHLSFAAFSVLRLTIAGGLLLGPTVLMGATLPVLAEYLARVEGRPVAPVVLYTLNLIGAAIGVALGGFVLLPALGVRGTIGVAALLNGAAGLAVLALPALPQVPAPAAATDRPVGARVPWLLGLAAAVSGALSLATQVAWTRVLTLVVGSTTYAFSAVLLVYLGALGAGSAWAARRRRLARPVGSDLAVMHGLAALGLLAALWAVNHLPYWYVRLYAVWGPETPGGGVARALVIAAAVLAVPVVCAGTILPLVLVGGAPAGGAGTGPAVGRLYALNTLGAIAGALLAGFVLIPLRGTQATLLAVVAAATAMGLAFARSGPPWLAAAGLATTLLVTAGIVWRPRWNFQDLNAGVSQPILLEAFRGETLTHPDERLLYAREGPTASVLVSRQIDDSRALIINARTNASDGADDMMTQVLLAQIPLLLAPRGERVFVVGWGSGVTVGSATQSPATEITAVELEPAVVEASQLFLHVNHDPLRDPRVRLYEDDARHLLLASEQSYDVIISEPSHPWVAGVANLFTQDFYRLVARRLEADGIFAQWLQTYQTSAETYRSVLATFQSVFPDVLVFTTGTSTDTVLVGSRQPIRLDLGELDRRWSIEATRAELARRGLHRPEHLLACFYLGPGSVRTLARGATINTDDNMYVEFRGARDMERGVSAAHSETLTLLESHAIPVETVLHDPATLLGNRARLLAFIDGLVWTGRETARYARLASALAPGAP